MINFVWTNLMSIHSGSIVDWQIMSMGPVGTTGNCQLENMTKPRKF